ncbi:universal stress protein [Variovorax dokdonensis]|uniref:Universal stress protein n=1 Tax=Variovorax dokdonensis TaxID=344883 RepID=A0ABT7NFR1_9BURK|nr:universal stress protein [Variovorax dokdonensis]MDM0046784.1 universal stress protein [Variovorax dokdonensis]
MFKKILVATDDSELSRRAVACAIGLARTHEARLVVVHVVPRYRLGLFEGAVSFSAEEIGAAEGQSVREAQVLLDEAARHCSDEGVDAKTVAISGDEVSRVLLQAARKHQCDLIVMASHGHKGLRRLLLGSQTQEVLAHSTLPVLVVR